MLQDQGGKNLTRDVIESKTHNAELSNKTVNLEDWDKRIQCNMSYSSWSKIKIW